MSQHRWCIGGTLLTRARARGALHRALHPEVLSIAPYGPILFARHSSVPPRRRTSRFLHTPTHRAHRLNDRFCRYVKAVRDAWEAGRAHGEAFEAGRASGEQTGLRHRNTASGASTVATSASMQSHTCDAHRKPPSSPATSVHTPPLRAAGQLPVWGEFLILRTVLGAYA